jgi:hypothetical protein
MTIVSPHLRTVEEWFAVGFIPVMPSPSRQLAGGSLWLDSRADTWRGATTGECWGGTAQFLHDRSRDHAKRSIRADASSSDVAAEGDMVAVGHFAPGGCSIGPTGELGLIILAVNRGGRCNRVGGKDSSVTLLTPVAAWTIVLFLTRVRDGALLAKVIRSRADSERQGDRPHRRANSYSSWAPIRFLSAVRRAVQSCPVPMSFCFHA